jgi:hypothetical protein
LLAIPIAPGHAHAERRRGASIPDV